MILSDAAVKRPVAMSALLIALLFLGANAFRGLSLEYMPKIDAPFVTVVTVWPGASPAELETDVLRPIEDAVMTIEGIRNVNAQAIENLATVVIQFEMDVDVDEAANSVREKVDLIVNDLPQAADRPKILKINLNAVPIVNLALVGNASVSDRYDYASQTLSARLATIRGVAEVRLVGGSDREVHVSLDRTKLASHGLTTMNVVDAIQKGIQTLPAGTIKDGADEYSVKFDAEYHHLSDIKTLQLTGRDGKRVFLRDVGTVDFADEDRREAAFLNGEPAIAVRIVKRSDANAAEVVNRVRAELDAINAELPEGMELAWVHDDGAFIQASVDSALESIIQAIGLTALILLIFLVNVRSTLIVAVTMPITYIISMFFLRMLDFTLNVSTLLSVGLSVGVLVTNSIVVLERIIKRLDAGENPKDASRLGTADVVIAVLASAGTNIVVLFPISVMGGMVGLFLRPFATTMIVVTAVSLFVSFTLTPMLASRLLKARSDKMSIGDKLARLQERNFAFWSRLYSNSIRFMSRHRWVALLILVGVFGMLMYSGKLAATLGTTLVPPSDQGVAFVKLEYSTRMNLDETTNRVREVEALLADMPHLERIYTTVGKVNAGPGQVSDGVNLAQLLLRFSDKTERDQGITELAELVRKRLADHPGAIVTVGLPSPMGSQQAAIEINVTGADLAVLDDITSKLGEQAEANPILTDVDTTVRAGKPELVVRPRRPVLADFGLPASMMGTMLRANLAGLVSGTYKEDGRSYDIRVQLTEEEGKEQVGRFLLPGGPGQPQLLTNLGEIEERRAPVLINRLNKRRVAKLLANHPPTVPLDRAVNTIMGMTEDSVKLPDGYRVKPGGTYEFLEESNREFGQALLIALVLTILLLAAIMESPVRPLLVLGTVPLAFIGVFGGLYLVGEAMSIYVMLGAVMLIGIVVNNAILIMEEVQALRADGVGAHEAMAIACGNQLRPVMMITAAAILGMLPLALGSGLGSEPRIGIGVASVGGIFASGVLTMLVIPALWVLFTRRDRKTPDVPTPVES